MDYLDLQPIRNVAGTVRLPGSKSISNRALLLAALAAGQTRLHGLLASDDTGVMLAALEKLGVAVEQRSDGVVVIDGAGGPFGVKSAELFLGNAGTAFRPLTAALAVCGGEYALSGVPRMHERPIGDLVDALTALGARIDYRGASGYPPLAIHAGQIRAGGGVSVRGDVSSQFLSALLMALPLTGERVTVAVTNPRMRRTPGAARWRTRCRSGTGHRGSSTTPWRERDPTGTAPAGSHRAWAAAR